MPLFRSIMKMFLSLSSHTMEAISNVVSVPPSHPDKDQEQEEKERTTLGRLRQTKKRIQKGTQYVLLSKFNDAICLLFSSFSSYSPRVYYSFAWKRVGRSDEFTRVKTAWRGVGERGYARLNKQITIFWMTDDRLSCRISHAVLSILTTSRSTPLWSLSQQDD